MTPGALNPARKGRTLVPTREGGAAGCAPVTGRGIPSVLVSVVAPLGKQDQVHGESLTATLEPEEAIELGLSLQRAGELADAERVLLERACDADEE